MKGSRSLLAAGIISSLAGCGGGTDGVMEPISAPRSWAERTTEERRQKDEQFKTDPASPLLPVDRPTFRGLSYWPPDPSYRFVGRLHVYERPERFTILTTTGNPRPCEKYGKVRFLLQGTWCTLQVYRLLDTEPLPGASPLFLPFTDGTTGKETYPAGRYVSLEGPEDGPYLLDFNRASNPWCAYGAPERFACPAAPAENRLSVRVEAGERAFLGTHGGG